MHFHIEQILELRGRTYVVVTALDDAPFAVQLGSRLGGVPVEPWLEQPRSVGPGGELDRHCFVFVLTTSQDAPRLSPGIDVALQYHAPQELSTQEGYDRWSEIYDEEFNPLIALEERETPWLLEAVQGKRVADVGCGTGRRSLAMAAAGAQVTALDFSQGMLARARAKPGAADLRFVVADITEPLPLAEAAFDVVTCFLVLDHIDDPAALFSELGRVARPDGLVLVTVMHPALMLRGIQAQFSDPENGEKLRPRSVPNQIADYVMAAGQAGLQIDAMREHAVDEELSARSPRARRYMGWPLLLVLQMSSAS
jgi:ubiquinone/menaquinone biosynthesis C-methylase UbiE